MRKNKEKEETHPAILIRHTNNVCPWWPFIAMGGLIAVMAISFILLHDSCRVCGKVVRSKYSVSMKKENPYGPGSFGTVTFCKDHAPKCDFVFESDGVLSYWMRSSVSVDRYGTVISAGPLGTMLPDECLHWFSQCTQTNASVGWAAVDDGDAGLRFVRSTNNIGYVFKNR